MWCFNGLYFKSRPQEKPLTSGTPVCLANTNKNTCIISLELAKSISSHLVTKRTLIWCQKLSCPEVHFSEDYGIEWKPGQEGLLPWAFSMLCLITLKDGVIVLILMASTCHSHETALRIARILRWQLPLGEKPVRHRALDAIHGPNQEKVNVQTPSFKSPQISFGQWHGCLFLPARAWRGQLQASVQQRSGKWYVNEVVLGWPKMRWQAQAYEVTCPLDNVNQRHWGWEARSPGLWFPNTRSRKEHSFLVYFHSHGGA